MTAPTGATSAGRATLVRHKDTELLETPTSAFRLLADSSATQGALGANLATLGPADAGAAPHYHALSSELFYVLDGAMTFLIGDDVVTVESGDSQRSDALARSTSMTSC